MRPRAASPTRDPASPARPALRFAHPEGSREAARRDSGQQPADRHAGSPHYRHRADRVEVLWAVNSERYRWQAAVLRVPAAQRQPSVVLQRVLPQRQLAVAASPLEPLLLQRLCAVLPGAPSPPSVC